VFLAALDFNSYTARKNPIGTIDAFQRAFPRKSGSERLLIKTINGHVHPEGLQELVNYCEEDARIVIVDGSLSRAETNGLIAATDCFVSLHRAEGFGRVLAEAMLLGTPVVGTDWSGSACLLDKHTGFPVAYTLADVSPGDYLFEEGSRWAEPLVDDAAGQLREVRRNRNLVESKLTAAKLRVSDNHGLDSVAQQVVKRLTTIARCK
jgi:glycosyltransferase involved in cell wall biosynthesis